MHGESGGVTTPTPQTPINTTSTSSLGAAATLASLRTERPPKVPSATPTLRAAGSPERAGLGGGGAALSVPVGPEQPCGHRAGEANGGEPRHRCSAAAADAAAPAPPARPGWARLPGDPGLGWLRWGGRGCAPLPSSFPPPPAECAGEGAAGFSAKLLAKQEGGLLGANSSGD